MCDFPPDLIQGKDIAKWVLQLKDVYCEYPDSIKVEPTNLMYRTLWLYVIEGFVEDMNNKLKITDDDANIIYYIKNSLYEKRSKKERENTNLYNY